MDRGQIRNRVFNLSEYAPDDAATGYTNFVNATIQEAYQHIWDECPWHFASKETKRVVRPDITQTDNHLGSAIATPTLAVTNGSRNATFSQSITETWMTKENAKLQILGREYDIVKRTSATVLEIDPPFQGDSTAIASATTDWKIFVRDYKMPDDCREILQVSFSNRVQDVNAYGYVDSIPERTVISENLNWTITQDKPNYYVPLPFDHQTVDSHSLPTLSVENSGSGELVPGTYHVGWSVYNSATGVESSIEIASITSTADFNIGITFAKPSKVGWNRKLYFGELQTDGSYKYIPMQGTGTLDLYGIQETKFISYNDTAKFTTGANQTPDKSHELYEYLVEHQGVQRFIRFYPRPQAKDYSAVGTSTSADRIEWAFFQVRYLFTPPQLKADTDVPAMPDSFHSLIVCKVMQTVYERLGNQAALDIEERRYKQKMEVLRSRFVTSYDTKCQMGNNWVRYRHWWIPTIRVG